MSVESAKAYYEWCKAQLERAKKEYSDDIEYIISLEEDLDNARFELAEAEGIEIYR